MAYYNESIDVRGDGRVMIFKRLNRQGQVSPTWFMRISLPLSQSKGYFQSTTKETKQGLASKIALDKFDELYAKVKDGGTIQGISFSKLFDLWEEHWIETSTQKTEKYKQHKVNNVRNYPLKFFKEVLKDIDVGDITENHLVDFVSWRKQNSYSPQNNEKYIPTASTINTDLTALSLMLEYGITKGFIKKRLKFKRQSVPDNRRPSFTKPEMKILTKHMRDRVKDSPPSVMRDRYYLQHYILILTNTGMRVGEFRNVKWENLRTKDYETDGGVEKRLIISIDGKTGRRDVVSNKNTETYVKRLYDYRKKELGDEPDSRECIICHLDGNPVRSFRKGYDALLKSINLTNDSYGNYRTIYSLRHYFATMRLEEEVSPYLLANNMGTSIEMLRKHYGQIVTERVAIELTKTKVKISVRKSTNEYPFD